MLRKNVSFYTKSGCSLCEKALLRIKRVREEIPFNLELVDITHFPLLKERHGLHIPVVFIDGKERFRYHVNEARFRALLASREK